MYIYIYPSLSLSLKNRCVTVCWATAVGHHGDLPESLSSTASIACHQFYMEVSSSGGSPTWWLIPRIVSG